MSIGEIISYWANLDIRSLVHDFGPIEESNIKKVLKKAIGDFLKVRATNSSIEQTCYRQIKTKLKELKNSPSLQNNEELIKTIEHKIKILKFSKNINSNISSVENYFEEDRKRQLFATEWRNGLYKDTLNLLSTLILDRELDDNIWGQIVNIYHETTNQFGNNEKELFDDFIVTHLLTLKDTEPKTVKELIDCITHAQSNLTSTHETLISEYDLVQELVLLIHGKNDELPVITSQLTTTIHEQNKGLSLSEAKDLADATLILLNLTTTLELGSRLLEEMLNGNFSFSKAIEKLAWEGLARINAINELHKQGPFIFPNLNLKDLETTVSRELAKFSIGTYVYIPRILDHSKNEITNFQPGGYTCLVVTEEGIRKHEMKLEFQDISETHSGIYRSRAVIVPVGSQTMAELLCPLNKDSNYSTFCLSLGPFTRTVEQELLVLKTKISKDDLVNYYIPFIEEFIKSNFQLKTNKDEFYIYKSIIRNKFDLSFFNKFIETLKINNDTIKSNGLTLPIFTQSFLEKVINSLKQEILERMHRYLLWNNGPTSIEVRKKRFITNKGVFQKKWSCTPIPTCEELKPFWKDRPEGTFAFLDTSSTNQLKLFFVEENKVKEADVYISKGGYFINFEKESIFEDVFPFRSLKLTLPDANFIDLLENDVIIFRLSTIADKIHSDDATFIQFFEVLNPVFSYFTELLNNTTPWVNEQAYKLFEFEKSILKERVWAIKNVDDWTEQKEIFKESLKTIRRSLVDTVIAEASLLQLELFVKAIEAENSKNPYDKNPDPQITHQDLADLKSYIAATHLTTEEKSKAILQLHEKICSKTQERVDIANELISLLKLKPEELSNKCNLILNGQDQTKSNHYQLSQLTHAKLLLETHLQVNEVLKKLSDELRNRLEYQKNEISTKIGSLTATMQDPKMLMTKFGSMNISPEESEEDLAIELAEKVGAWGITEKSLQRAPFNIQGYHDLFQSGLRPTDLQTINGPREFIHLFLVFQSLQSSNLLKSFDKDYNLVDLFQYGFMPFDKIGDFQMHLNLYQMLKQAKISRDSLHENPFNLPQEVEFNDLKEYGLLSCKGPIDLLRCCDALRTNYEKIHEHFNRLEVGLNKLAYKPYEFPSHVKLIDLIHAGLTEAQMSACSTTSDLQAVLLTLAQKFKS